MTEKKIIVACRGADVLPLDSLVPLQGNLKSLSQVNYEKLKKVILDQGFSAPEFVWQSKGTNYILDGHQRVRVLKKLQEEGYTIPPIPVDYIEAKDKAEAQRKLLALASQYGEVTDDGLYEFIIDAEITMPEVESDFRFPEIDPEIFKAEYFDKSPEFIPTDGKEQGRLDQKTPVTCPQCGHEFIPK